ncbi:MAG: hypothetical protein BVN28_10960 [Nitrospira sp. ST-bin4]|nr:MAG: hypothetical protein BVN28_10960 [Nitrospira sp. ST-bin4]
MARNQRAKQRQQRLCSEHLLYAISYMLFYLTRYASQGEIFSMILRRPVMNLRAREKAGRLG